MATLLGRKTTIGGTTFTVFRLDNPVLDVGPNWQIICVETHPDRPLPKVYRGRCAYEGLDTVWKIVPGEPNTTWRACYSPFTPRAFNAIVQELTACDPTLAPLFQEPLDPIAFM